MKMRHLLLASGLVMSLFSMSYASAPSDGGFTQGEVNTADTNLAMDNQGAADTDKYFCSSCYMKNASEAALKALTRAASAAPSSGTQGGDDDGQR